MNVQFLINCYVELLYSSWNFIRGFAVLLFEFIYFNGRNALAISNFIKNLSNIIKSLSNHSGLFIVTRTWNISFYISVRFSRSSLFGLSNHSICSIHSAHEINPVARVNPLSFRRSSLPSRESEKLISVILPERPWDISPSPRWDPIFPFSRLHPLTRCSIFSFLPGFPFSRNQPFSFRGESCLQARATLSPPRARPPTPWALASLSRSLFPRWTIP